MGGNNVYGRRGRAVVHHDDLEQIPRQALDVQAAQTGFQRGGLVEVRNNHRNHALIIPSLFNFPGLFAAIPFAAALPFQCRFRRLAFNNLKLAIKWLPAIFGLINLNLN
jgi:hypothetical protein